MNRPWILVAFLAISVALGAGTVAFMLDDDDALSPPVTQQEELQQASLETPETPSFVPAIVPFVDHSATENEAELEQLWYYAIREGDWDLARELRKKLFWGEQKRSAASEVERPKAEFEKAWDDRPDPDRPIEVRPEYLVRLPQPRERAFDSMPRGSDGTAPMPFGGSMFGPWDTGGRLTPGR